MDDYGKDFIAGSAGDELHWMLRPFWHRLQVIGHLDGVSVHAHDDLPPQAPAEVVLLGHRPQPTPAADRPAEVA